MFKLTVIAMGNKMPDWVMSASQVFMKRLREGICVQWIDIPLHKRGKVSDLSRILDKEKRLMQDAIPPNTRLIALDRGGKVFSSEALALTLADLQQKNPHVCCLIGGPEGIAPDLLALADERWSLSSLTLPHTLARIVLLETVYRSWSILHNHPYHK